MSWTFCSSGAAVIKAGANCSTIAKASGAILEAFSTDAEGRICAELHTDFITGYSGLDTGIKYMLSDICSSLIAMNIVSYDMSGYTDRREAETILDVLDDRVRAGLKTLTPRANQKLNSVSS